MNPQYFNSMTLVLKAKFNIGNFFRIKSCRLSGTSWYFSYHVGYTITNMIKLTALLDYDKNGEAPVDAPFRFIVKPQICMLS